LQHAKYCVYFAVCFAFSADVKCTSHVIWCHLSDYCELNFMLPPKNTVAALSVRPSVRPIRVRPITLLFVIRFLNYFTEMTTMLRQRVSCNIWVLTLKVKVTVKPCSKSWLAHNFVIWNQISKIFHRNDYHNDMMCHVQTIYCYLVGQGHSMPLQQNRVQPITLTFEVEFQNYFTNMTTILRPVRRNILVTIYKVKGTA